MVSTVLILNFAATATLVGLIWTVQAVHYPAFAFVEPERFRQFQVFHERRITWIVAPVMVMELGLALILLAHSVTLWAVANLATIAVLWIITFLISVPIHQKLHAGKNLNLIRRLILTNWLRTALWTARLIGFAIYFQQFH